MKAARLLLAIIMTAPVYGHDVASAVFSDRKTLERFIAATDVRAVRLFLKKSPDGTMAEDPGQLSNYTRGESTVTPEAAARELRTLFTAESSFLWHSEPKNGLRQVKACSPDYGVLITFRGSAGVVSIALCFKCDLFGVFWRDGDKAFRVNVEEDCDLIRPQLIALVKRLFPEDADIQALQPTPKT